MSIVRPQTDGDLIADILRRLGDLERSSQLGNASYQSPGLLRYLNADGDALMYFGRVDAGGHPSDGVIFYRPDGTLAFAFYEPSPGFGHITVFYDRAGNSILVDDTASGVGLARPYLPLPFTKELLSNEVTTAAATFTNVWRIDANLQHPTVGVKVFGRSIGGAAGELRIYDATDGVVLGSAQTVSVGAYNEYGFNVEIPAGSYGTYHDLKVQARVTNATGTIGVEVTRAYGLQS